MRRGITGVAGGGHGQQAYPEEQPRLVCFGCFRSLLLLPRLRWAGGGVRLEAVWCWQMPSEKAWCGAVHSSGR